jgi:hypothetical protein
LYWHRKCPSLRFSARGQSITRKHRSLVSTRSICSSMPRPAAHAKRTYISLSPCSSSPRLGETAAQSCAKGTWVRIDSISHDSFARCPPPMLDLVLDDRVSAVTRARALSHRRSLLGRNVGIFAHRLTTSPRVCISRNMGLSGSCSASTHRILPR